MNLFKPTLFSLFILLLLVSCLNNDPIDIDKEIYVPVENTRLYLRLVGNSNGPLIINLHGGPGAFSGFDHISNKKYLEDDYLFAYLDQRGGGKSDAVLDTTTFNMQQFVDDLDVVVDTLQNRFKDKNVNLVGSSWGGTLGLLYMMEHQDKITSFACVSGKADGLAPIIAIIEYEREIATSLIEKTDDSIKKKRYKEILQKLDEVENSNFDQFYKDMNLIKHTYPKELGFNAYWANKQAKERAIELGKDSSYYAEAHYTKEEFNQVMDKFEIVNRVFRNTPEYNHLNIIDEISTIHKPILVVQGREDYVIGIEQAKMIYNALTGVPEAKKELHIIPNASHNLNMEAPEPYYRVVKDFFDKFNPE